MFSAAAVTVSTRADFVVEGAVNFVLLGAEDGGEEVGHFDGLVEDGEEFGGWVFGGVEE